MSSSKGTAQGGFWFACAVWSSDLPSTSRLVALVIGGKADSASGVLTASLTHLAKATGLDRTTVARHLRILEREGFIKRRAPEKWAAIRNHEMTEYTCVIPRGYPVRGSGPVPLGLVAESPKASGRAPHSTTSTNAGGASAGASAPPSGTNGWAPSRVAIEAAERWSTPMRIREAHPHQDGCCNADPDHPIHAGEWVA